MTISPQRPSLLNDHLPLQSPLPTRAQFPTQGPSPSPPQPWVADTDAGDTLPSTTSCSQPQQHHPAWTLTPSPSVPGWGWGFGGGGGAGAVAGGGGAMEPLDRWAAETVAPRPAAARSRSSALAGKRAKFSRSPRCQLCSPAPSRRRGRRAAGLAPSSALSLLRWGWGGRDPTAPIPWAASSGCRGLLTLLAVLAPRRRATTVPVLYPSVASVARGPPHPQKHQQT